MKTLIASAALALFAFPASAAVNCADRQDVLDILGGKYGEARQSFALTDKGVLAEIFANLETGSWTVIYTTPGSPESCVVAQGAGYTVDPAAPGGDPA